MRVLVVGSEAARRDTVLSVLTAAMAAGDGMVQVCGVDIARDRTEFEVVGWQDGQPISWHHGDVRALLSGPYARRGWLSRCLDPATDYWETFRQSKRAARRSRGRARAAARLRSALAARR